MNHLSDSIKNKQGWFNHLKGWNEIHQHRMYLLKFSFKDKTFEFQIQIQTKHAAYVLGQVPSY